MPEEQSVHARDGVADPQGCGNPLRSGVTGLSFAAASPPHPQESASSRPRTHPPEATPYPARKACHARRAKRPRQGWRGRSAGMRESFAIGHGGSFDRSGLTAATGYLAHRIKKRQAGFPLTCRFCNEPQLMPDNLLVVFSRVVFIFRFRCNLFIVRIRFRRDIILAFRHAAVD